LRSQKPLYVNLSFVRLIGTIKFKIALCKQTVIAKQALRSKPD